jgi:predicted DNA binding protein
MSDTEVAFPSFGGPIIDERAILMEAVLSVDIPGSWFRDVLPLYLETATILGCKPHGDRGCHVLIEMEIDPNGARDLVSALLEHPQVEAVDLDHKSNGYLKGTIISRTDLVCPALTRGAAFILEAWIDDKGLINIRLLMTSRDILRLVISEIEYEGHSVNILKVASMEPRGMLTPRQEDMLLLAYETGFFDRPTRISLTELARLRGVTVSTVSETLSKARRKVMQEFFSSGI